MIRRDKDTRRTVKSIRNWEKTMAAYGRAAAPKEYNLKSYRIFGPTPGEGGVVINSSDTGTNGTTYTKTYVGTEGIQPGKLTTKKEKDN